jgi:hypothetical protein
MWHQIPEYLRWGFIVATTLGLWRLAPLAVVRLVGAFTENEDRHRRCMEVLRISRKDARFIRPYVEPKPTDPNMHGTSVYSGTEEPAKLPAPTSSTSGGNKPRSQRKPRNVTATASRSIR